LIPPPAPEDSQGVTAASAPPVPCAMARHGASRRPGLASHRTAHRRVVLRAGAAVEEAVVESDVFDLSTGTRASDDVAGLFQNLETRVLKPAAATKCPTLARCRHASLRRCFGCCSATCGRRTRNGSPSCRPPPKSRSPRSSIGSTATSPLSSRTSPTRSGRYDHGAARAAPGRGGAPPPGQGDRASTPARRGSRAGAACGVGAEIGAWPRRTTRGATATRGNRCLDGCVSTLRQPSYRAGCV